MALTYYLNQEISLKCGTGDKTKNKELNFVAGFECEYVVAAHTATYGYAEDSEALLKKAYKDAIRENVIKPIENDIEDLQDKMTGSGKYKKVSLSVGEKADCFSEIKELQKKKKRIEKIQGNVNKAVYGSIIVKGPNKVKVVMDFSKLKPNMLKELLGITDLTLLTEAQEIAAKQAARVSEARQSSQNVDRKSIGDVISRNLQEKTASSDNEEVARIWKKAVDKANVSLKQMEKVILTEPDVDAKEALAELRAFKRQFEQIPDTKAKIVAMKSYIGYETGTKGDEISEEIIEVAEVDKYDENFRSTIKSALEEIDGVLAET